jgi:hypothetical protein
MRSSFLHFARSSQKQLQLARRTVPQQDAAAAAAENDSASSSDSASSAESDSDSSSDSASSKNAIWTEPGWGDFKNVPEENNEKLREGGQESILKTLAFARMDADQVWATCSPATVRALALSGDAVRAALTALVTDNGRSPRPPLISIPRMAGIAVLESLHCQASFPEPAPDAPSPQSRAAAGASAVSTPATASEPAAAPLMPSDVAAGRASDDDLATQSAALQPTTAGHQLPQRLTLDTYKAHRLSPYQRQSLHSNFVCGGSWRKPPKAKCIPQCVH